jgi:hypothetical protein
MYWYYSHKLHDVISWFFNCWDYTRVDYYPKRNRSNILLAFPPYEWLILERIFWGESDLSGNYSETQNLEISFRDGGISGISFIYDSGMKRTLGSQEGEKAEMLLEPGESLTRLDSVLRNTGPVCALTVSRPRLQETHLTPMQLYTNRGRQLTVDARHPMDEEEETARFMPLNPTLNIPTEEPESRDYPYPDAAGRFVGLWGVTGPQGKYLWTCGPIFTIID